MDRQLSLSITRNLDGVLGAATPADLAAGAHWYPDANARINAMCALWHYPHRDRAYAATSVLSPRLSWPRNVIIAHTMIRAHGLTGWYGRLIESDNPEDRVKLGYGMGAIHGNVDRAHAILSGAAPIAFSQRARKTAAFTRNLSGDLEPVTVDSWIAYCALSEKLPSTKGIGARLYDAIAAAIVAMAKQCAMSPAALQAVLWVAIQRMRLHPMARH